ncbi:cytochrome P450 [Leucogyrophana mollusca]|uniref:Cytochrome P450 n=1 Tax=Leucogyrophana mollusca TaxID=85980 RepID=A0ACB8BNW0_9AGAM|nr:cytochrome P450 [Leucogyrophana mollusca]
MSALTESPLLALAITCAAALFIGGHLAKKKSGPPLPPGPPPLPVVGNVRGIDTHAPWRTYREWGYIYGPIVHTRLFDKHICIINTEEDARELLDRRSQIYSDRPEIATNELFGSAFNSAFLRYGPRWRLHRRLFHQTFRPDHVQTYRPMQLQKGYQLLLGLLDTPEDIFGHLKRSVCPLQDGDHPIPISYAHRHGSSIIMAAAYGYDTKPRDDPYVTAIQKALDFLIAYLSPQASAVVGAFPFILWLPSWFPGLSIKSNAAKSRLLVKEWVDRPFEYVQETINSGTAVPSMATDFLTKQDEQLSPDMMAAIKEASATAFAAGAETTIGALRVFVYAMMKNPEVQKKAQAEIDAVVGTERLPTFDDRRLLPYIDAIVRETLRWLPILPLGVPHATTEDDVYKGYLIPKGSLILANIWAMGHDEARFSNPSEFKPERFLTPGGELTDEALNFAWGFGRRSCVGRHMADASVWSAIVLILSTFNISKQKDNEGREIDAELDWSVGVTVRLEPFPCALAPRSKDMTAERLAALFSASA